MNSSSSSKPGPRSQFYLVGINVTHSIAPPMHNHILASLDQKTSHFAAQECPTIDSAMSLFRAPSFGGAVVTMPYKSTIMPHLDGVDEVALKIGAVNNVYLDNNSQLRGTNTDWRGIWGCLVNADSQANGRGKPAVIVGAGGASRAAVYALYEKLECRTIYVVNRDVEEVARLVKDARTYGERLKIVHVRSVYQARELMQTQPPYYIVGTVPDFEPSTEEELEARDVLQLFLEKSNEKGVLLDMCFKPRRTRTLKMGEKYGWTTIEGTGIIGHQIGEQYRLWFGEEAVQRVPTEPAWKVLRKAADESAAINF